MAHAHRLGRWVGLVALVAVGVGSAGCAASDGATSSEAEAVAATHESLAQITADDLVAAYGATVAREVAEAARANPDVAEVSAAGLAVFAGHRQTLKGGLTWYFERTGASKVAVDAIEGALVEAVRAQVEAAVGADGFVDEGALNGAPREILWAVDDARFDASLRRAKAPRGIDLPDLFDHFRAEHDVESLHLPVRFSRAPSGEEAARAFGIDLGRPLWGDVARRRIAQAFDSVVLEPALDPVSGIKEVWYLSALDYGTSEEHVALFLDEHDQVWGFRVIYQAD